MAEKKKQVKPRIKNVETKSVAEIARDQKVTAKDIRRLVTKLQEK